MDTEKFRDEIKKLVEHALSQHTSAGIEKDVEEALKKAEQMVMELTEKLVDLEKVTVDASSKLEALENSNNELGTALSTKSEEFVILAKERTVLEERAINAEVELSNLKKDMLVKDRMVALESLKIVRSGDARDKQMTVIREMSEEMFASYKDEMVAMRAEFLMTASSSVPVVVESATTNEPEMATAEPAVAPLIEEVTLVPPADVAGALETASVPPNAETVSPANKWAEIGKKFSLGMSMLLDDGRNSKTEDKR
jgi:hypothetical protein